jgi:gas vesicle protein
LDQPDNFWGLETWPDDWSPRSESSARAEQLMPDYVRLRAVVAEFVEPLQAEIKELREKLAQASPRRSQFDLSLSHIPPEVEEKLLVRLREDLGAQALRQASQQSEQVLEAAKEAIGKKITKAHNDFREEIGQNLHSVEQRAQGLAEEITDAAQNHLASGAERLQKQVLEAGIRLEGRSEEFLRALQLRLGDEHDAFRREAQKVQAAVGSESARLQAQNADLATRMAKLGESARKLESDLDSRLVQMGSDIIAGARTQLEKALDTVLKELSTRNSQELGRQRDEACEHLKSVQKGIEGSISQLLKTEVTGALLSFGQTMEELAQDSVGQWRQALARDLSSFASTLGRQLRPDGASKSQETQYASRE